MLRLLLLPLACLPLAWLHATGAAVGMLALRLSPRTARRMRENVVQAGVAGPAGGDPDRFCRDAAREAGKALAELPFVWFASPRRFVRSCCLDATWREAIDEHADGPGRPTIFVTPHLGAFEANGRIIAERAPIAIMYRPPKIAALEPLLVAGRRHGRASLAPANARGVRMVLKALRAGDSVGILPDQTPGVGDGVWAPFFGRPAYTMTLIARLQRATRARVIIGFAERLPRGRGFSIHGSDLGILPADPEEAAAALNAAVESLVRQRPEQYLWSYNRYKVPAGVSMPGAGVAAPATFTER